jgi:hypothetical protein
MGQFPEALIGYVNDAAAALRGGRP